MLAQCAGCRRGDASIFDGLHNDENTHSARARDRRRTVGTRRIFAGPATASSRLAMLCDRRGVPRPGSTRGASGSVPLDAPRRRARARPRRPGPGRVAALLDGEPVATSTPTRSTSPTARPGTGWSSTACGRSPAARSPATARWPGGSAGRERRGRSAGRSAATRSGLLVPCHRVIAGDGSLGGYGVAPGAGARRRWTSKRALLRSRGRARLTCAGVGSAAPPV